MRLNFQYNKTSLNNLTKQLKIRQAALPILKNKETALRTEVIRQKKKSNKNEEALNKHIQEGDRLLPLVGRFPIEIIELHTLDIQKRKIAGVKIPELKELDLRFDKILWHEAPHWFTDVLTYLKKLAELKINDAVAKEQLRILEMERKRTTQKVNLFEKVQIPEHEEAIKKIKKYLEDKENLSKAAQKIVKARKSR